MKSIPALAVGLGCFGLLAASSWAQSVATTQSAPAAAATTVSTSEGPAIVYGQAAFPAPMLAPGVSYSGHSKATQLAQKYIKADKAGEKEELKKEMIELFSKEFDEHLKQQQKEIEELDKQLTQLKATLKKRQEAKTTIVDRHFEQVVQEADGLGWSVPRTGRTISGFGGAGGGFGGAWSTPAPASAPARAINRSR